MQLISNLDTGGAQEVVRTLARELQEYDCSPTVCSFKDGPLRAAIEDLNVPVNILSGRRHSVLNLPFFIIEMFQIRAELLKLIDDLGVNVVQTHLLRSLDFLVLSLRISAPELQVFITIHNSAFTLRSEHLTTRKWLLRPKQVVHRLLYRLTQRWTAGYIAVSESVAPSIVESLNVVPAKVNTICNGVDYGRYALGGGRQATRSALGLQDSDQVLIVVAALVPQKGHAILLQALARMLPQVPDLRVLLIGDGHLRQQLTEQARELGLERHVRFLGLRSDVPDLLRAADYFALPSLWEGLPMALIEAMAAALPVVATRVSGSKEVVVDGETGLLVAPGDVEELAHTLTRLMADRELARRMGRAGQRRVAQMFSARRQAREHVALFRRAVFMQPV